MGSLMEKADAESTLKPTAPCDYSRVSAFMSGKEHYWSSLVNT